MYIQPLIPSLSTLHRKKRFTFTSFPSPAGMSLTKLPLGRNNSVMTSLFPPRESLVVTSRLGTGNSRNFFLRCSSGSHLLQYIGSGSHLIYWQWQPPPILAVAATSYTGNGRHLPYWQWKPPPILAVEATSHTGIGSHLLYCQWQLNLYWQRRPLWQVLLGLGVDEKYCQAEPLRLYYL